MPGSRPRHACRRSSVRPKAGHPHQFARVRIGQPPGAPGGHVARSPRVQPGWTAVRRSARTQRSIQGNRHPRTPLAHSPGPAVPRRAARAGAGVRCVREVTRVPLARPGRAETTCGNIRLCGITPRFGGSGPHEGVIPHVIRSGPARFDGIGTLSFRGTRPCPGRRRGRPVRALRGISRPDRGRAPLADPGLRSPVPAAQIWRCRTMRPARPGGSAGSRNFTLRRKKTMLIAWFSSAKR
jgi:hypothetical protein